MSFVPDYPTNRLQSADYNPRRIESEALGQLEKSILELGVIKPLILNGNGQIAAGHQRAKVCIKLGIDRVPAIVLARVCRQDEILFNLFHNRVETNLTPTRIVDGQALPPGYSLVRYHRLEHDQNRNPVVVTEIAKLIVRYGQWGCLIVDDQGYVLDNSDYAVAAKSLQEDMLIYKVPNHQVEAARRFLSAQYGTYHYAALDIKAFNQHLCQMNRLTGNHRLNLSGLYEQFVLPALAPEQRLLDFGAGRCAYVNRLRAEDYHAFAYEPHYADGGSKIDLGQVVRFISAIESDLSAHGLYDVVVLDGVLNSITSIDFERLVLTVCNGLTGHQGSLFVGTRSLDFAISRESRQKATRQVTQRHLQFYDENNFTATFRSGVWTMQRFHTVTSLRSVLDNFYESVEIVDRKRSDLWAICKGPKELPLEQYREALEVEFNMEYPGGVRHNKHAGLVEAILARLEERRARSSLPRN